MSAASIELWHGIEDLVDFFPRITKAYLIGEAAAIHLIDELQIGHIFF